MKSRITTKLTPSQVSPSSFPASATASSMESSSSFRMYLTPLEASSLRGQSVGRCYQIEHSCLQESCQLVSHFEPQAGNLAAIEFEGGCMRLCTELAISYHYIHHSLTILATFHSVVPKPSVFGDALTQIGSLNTSSFKRLNSV